MLTFDGSVAMSKSLGFSMVDYKICSITQQRASLSVAVHNTIYVTVVEDRGFAFIHD